MDPFDFPIRQNPLKTRDDLRQSLVDLLEPLNRHVSGGGYDLGRTAAHYSPRVALMEGWSRTLWGIAPFIAGGGDYPNIDEVMAILTKGLDENDPGWWGVPPDRDQRLVEMAAIALSLMIAQETFWDSLKPDQRKTLARWLGLIQERELPANNWHFFRVLVCTALRRLGLPVNEKAERESFDLIESCYRGDGWYIDGSNGEYDWYNPFAFHFYGLIYATINGGRDPQRAERYTERARLFAPRFITWFRDDGSVVPYGRSLIYRFAAVSFFSACAFAGLEVFPWGVMKGLVLRHFRWWFSRPILDAGGILSVGYAYPNLIMADQYNSPGSPYWALKSYLVLALPDGHPFWAAEEQPLPADLPEVSADPVPGFLVSRSDEDVQLLVPGRYPVYEVVQAAAKYGKFAYSARFGFCVSHGSYDLEKTGCDSTLLFSEGDNYWRERRAVRDQTSGPNWTRSLWSPWPDVTVATTLVALGAWHVRIHKIESSRTLDAVEGGFSVPLYCGREPAVPPETRADTSREALVSFAWGASRIAALEAGSNRTGTLVEPSPNLNLLEPSGIIPVLKGKVKPGITIWVTAVRAGDPGPAASEKPPRVVIEDEKTAVVFRSGGTQAAVLEV
ncbi:DUF2264 domain-containing protein [Breznakiella homolactica]|uniref:DUF2264 domain-containing protein n=1 Tax=Breznakiella homolactica TaxID=2798577 RepID=A0A7T8BD35_9SPIR|nr:DUF2264 domain-containing protein [Breznakiella homolactica]QQO10848.1 DUF2264 domain-containing protein [Breznakiella homolactica]